jgi:DNA polymerase-3 subunit alpha
MVSDFINVFTRDSFYLEIIAIDFEKQKIINKFLLEYAKNNNIKAIVTTDSHYYDKDQNEIYKAISKLYNYYDSDACDLHLKTKEDVYQILNYIDRRDIDWLFDNLQELENSIEEINIEFDNTIPQVYDRDYLISKAKSKLIDLGLHNNEAYLERLKREIEVYDKTESWNYISVCYDIAKYCNENNILRSSGRGSASSSLLFYLLEMTFIDPIKYGLVFERFMDESRAKRLIYQ